MNFTTKKFSELTLEQLYKILKLRYGVFVREQQSIYDEFDEMDYNAIHIFLEEKKKIVAYLRVYKKSDKTACLGRAAVDKEHRKKGIGKEIVKHGLNYIKNNFKAEKTEISAQDYLQKFYESFGFKRISDVYDDCGVEHIDMVLELK
ncbi:GNAT family N-acetyltransferase [Candidatus Woesearchaeota archaeon]|nr:GNAT family N-acetyltransferase [Candidatus Woesearchaeota archaeon]